MSLPVTRVNTPQNMSAIKCPFPMTPKGICIHNTANDASAMSEISYMLTNTMATSFHYAVDDYRAVQGLPLDRNGWHAGDGSSGNGNRNYIGIEICYSLSGGQRYLQAEANGVILAAELLHQKGWGVDRLHLAKHQDFSGKYCPHRILSQTGWDNFVKKVDSKLRELKGVPAVPVAGGGKDMSKPFIARGTDGIYRIQLGAFSVKANADAELARIQAVLDGRPIPTPAPTPAPKPAPTPTPTYKTFTLGERVRFRNPSANLVYAGASAGVAIPYSVKIGTYTVQQIRGSGATQELLLQEIVSWVYARDMM